MLNASTVPLVSVIIPAYNRGDMIATALDSVKTQDYADFEILVIDDHSTDATRDIIAAQQARDPRIRYLLNTHTKGVSGARNTGLDNCMGDYIAFLDSDDYWFPGYLARAVGLLEVHRDIDSTFANRLHFDLDSGSDIGSPFPSRSLFSVTKEESLGACSYVLRDNLIELFLRSNWMPIMTVVLRVSSLDGLRFDEHMTVSEDRDFCLRFCCRKGISVAFQDVSAAHVARHIHNLSNHNHSNEIRFIEAHVYLLGKLLADPSCDPVIRQRVQKQIELERSAIPYYLRKSGRYGAALGVVARGMGAHTIRHTATESAKIVFGWCAQNLLSRRT